MPFLANAWSLISVIPDAIILAKEFMIWINRGGAEKIKTASLAFSQLNAAQTTEERQDAAKAIAQAIAGVPS